MACLTKMSYVHCHFAREMMQAHMTSEKKSGEKKVI